MASTRDEADIDTAGLSGNPLIDGLLGEFYWSKLATENFQFTFPDSETDYEATRDGLVDSYPDYVHERVFEMPLYLRTAIRLALEGVDGIVSFSIVEQGDNNVDTQLRYAVSSFGSSDLILFASAHQPEDDGIGSEQDNWMSGDVFFTRYFFKNPESPNPVGTMQYFAVLHETGHALGLKHGHLDEDGHGPLPLARDTLEFTVMTNRTYFNDNPNRPRLSYGLDPGNFPQTMMMLDIQALQYLYGADYTTRKGDTTYSWSTSGSYLINGLLQWAPATDKIFLTVWDGGGSDTYDFSAFATDQRIDLKPGGWSNIGSNLAELGGENLARGNVFNALMFNNNTNSLIENAIGGSGNDDIEGNVKENLLNGGAGNDDLLGLVGNDSLVGGNGNDELFGNEGDDRLDGGAGSDLLNGGKGFNIAVYDAPGGSTVTITPVGDSGLRWDVTGPAEAAGDILANIGALVFGNGADKITLNNTPSVSNLWIDGAGGNDTITGSNGVTDKDFLIGGAGSDRIVVRRGSFEVYGGWRAKDGSWIERPADNDLLVIDRTEFGGYYNFWRLNDASSPLGVFHGFADDSTARGIARLHFTGSNFVDDIRGGIGNDMLLGAGGEDNFNAGAGDDYLVGGAGADDLSGEEGDDTIIGGSGDQIYGFAGNDLIQAPAASALAGLGNDTISGGTAAEIFYGDEGNDVLIGGGGEDLLNGGTGRDVIEGGGGPDFVSGGDGIDEASYVDSNAGVTVNLALRTATGGHAAGDRIDSIENIRGSAFNDNLSGDANHNQLIGLGGGDSLTGAQGNDRFVGGQGADTFRYPAKAFGRDTIVDFEDGIDKISLVGSGLTFSSFTETKSGAHTVLTLKSAPANTITLLDVDPGQISATDFLV